MTGLPVTLAEAAAWLGLLGRATWPLFPGRRAMLLMQLGIGLSFAAHYALIGLPTAAVTGGLGVAQTLAALWLGERRPRLAQGLGYAVLPAMGLGAVLTWHGLASLLAAAGLMLIAWARLQPTATTMARAIMAGQGFLLAHDLLVGAWIAALADVIGLGVGLFLMARREGWRRLLRLTSRGAVRASAWAGAGP